jgi:hypothetical protein
MPIFRLDVSTVLSCLQVYIILAGSWQFPYGAVPLRHTTMSDPHRTVQTHTKTTQQALEKLCASVKRHVLGNDKYKTHLLVGETTLAKRRIFCYYVNCVQG